MLPELTKMEIPRRRTSRRPSLLSIVIILLSSICTCADTYRELDACDRAAHHFARCTDEEISAPECVPAAEKLSRVLLEMDCAALTMARERDRTDSPLRSWLQRTPLAVDNQKRNAYMLDPTLRGRLGLTENPLCKEGYDWWWHNFTAVGDDGEERPFFIEYFIINPCLGGDEPILGQLEENQKKGARPSYGMIKAGTWGREGGRQIHNFFGISKVRASTEKMEVRIGKSVATERRLEGAVSLTAEEAAAHPEFMSDPGRMSWKLKVDKRLAYNVGHGASELARSFNAFQMFWHINGMKTEYSGTVTYNGKPYRVIPERSYGYQDKNWGSDFTNPWVWLSSNHFVDAVSGKPLPMTSLDVGGGLPEIFEQPLWETALVAFHHGGKLYEFNFSKLLERNRVVFEVDTKGDRITWRVQGENGDHRIEILFTNPKSKMLLVNYESPRGERNHRELWNGGHAEGSVKLFERSSGTWKKIVEAHGTHGGCEYGVADKPK